LTISSQSKTQETNNVKEEVIFEDYYAGLSLKKFKKISIESQYVFYFKNDSNFYPGKIMTIYFNTWNDVLHFFKTTNIVIEQKKHIKYSFDNQSYKISWATKNLAIIYSGNQYCYISKSHIAEICLKLR
jgi:hypothetical protein